MIALWLAAAAAGDLYGTLRDPDGAPVRDAFVVAYDARFQFEYALSGADGGYAIRELPAGRWRVRVLPSMSSDVAEIWLGGSLGACAAEVIELPPTQGRRADLTLPFGASLEGRLVDPDGAPLPGVRVSARTLRAAPIAQTRYAFTDGEGRYAVRGIPADSGPDGTFVLELAAGGLPPQYLPGTYDLVAATAHTVAPRDAVVVGEDTPLAGVVLEGVVRGPEGPVPGATVSAFAGTQTVGVTAGEDGAYRFVGLPEGEVLLWAAAPGLATTWWPDAPIPDERLALSGEGSTHEVDLTLPAESRLRGRLIPGPWTGSSLVVYDEGRAGGVGAPIAEDGTFDVGGLHPGRYVVYVDGDGDGRVSDLLRDAAGEAQVFAIEATGPAELGEIEVPEAARVEGLVIDAGSGQPVYGATVVAIGQRTGGRRTAATDRAGRYALAGLGAEPWAVHVEHRPSCPGDPSWIATYYPGRVNPTLAGVAALGPGDVLTWDVQVGPDADTDGMDDTWELAHGLDPAVDDAALDPDGDGFSNRDEFLLGTDPRVGVAPGGCGRRGGGGIALVWLPVVAGRRRARR